MARTRVLVIGAGGHARVCAEALGDDETIDVVGAVSGDGAAIDGLGLRIIGRDDQLAELASEYRLDAAHIAIGDNAARARVAERWLATGRSLATCVSRFAMLSRTCELSGGVAALPGAVVNAATTIGRGTILNTNSSVDHDSRIGDFVHIAPGATLGGGVTVGDGTFVGLGARILPGVTVGARAMIGAGAVVLADVGADSTVVGVPARVVTRR